MRHDTFNKYSPPLVYKAKQNVQATRHSADFSHEARRLTNCVFLKPTPLHPT